MATKDSTDDLKLDDERIPLLPLRDVVVFPHTVIPLFVGRKSSVNAITEAHMMIFIGSEQLQPYCKCSSCQMEPLRY